MSKQVLSVISFESCVWSSAAHGPTGFVLCSSSSFVHQDQPPNSTHDMSRVYHLTRQRQHCDRHLWDFGTLGRNYTTQNFENRGQLYETASNLETTLFSHTNHNSSEFAPKMNSFQHLRRTNVHGTTGSQWHEELPLLYDRH